MMRGLPFVFVAVSLGIMACRSDSRGRPSADTTSATASAAPSGHDTAAGAVPASIEAIGAHGEDTYDYVKLGDWAKARATADSLRPAIDSVPASATTDNASRADVATAFAELDRAISAKDRTAALRASNRLTELGARLSAAYHPQVPPDVTLLDYFGREIELGAAVRDTAGLRQTVVALRHTWDAVRPQVVARGGAGEARRFDAIVARVEAAKTPEEYVRTAKPLLDAVDTLELVFTR